MNDHQKDVLAAMMGAEAEETGPLDLGDWCLIAALLAFAIGFCIGVGFLAAWTFGWLS